ncbi:MAG: phosphatase PAP2 family protein [bacterium]
MSVPPPQSSSVTLLPSPAARIGALALFLAVLALYPILNRPWATVHSVALPLDSVIYVVPVFVVPYLFFFFPWAIALILWSILRRPAVYERLIISMTIGLLISYGVYVVFQTVVVRQPIEGSDVFSTLLRWVYQSDARYNAFPSTHTVATVVLVATTWRVVHASTTRILVLLIAILILCATLLTKQHNILDVAFGLIVGTIAFLVGDRVTRVRDSRATRQSQFQESQD